MFRPTGRISLKEVWDALGSEVLKRFQEDGRAEDYQSLSEATAEACWDFCKQAAIIRVMLPAGALVDVASYVLRTADTSQTFNEHIDLQIGTIGSGKGGDRRESSLKMLYGPALFCHVVFTDREFSKFYNTFAGSPNLESNSDRAIIDRIVAAYREDPTRNRQVIYEIAAHQISWRHYLHLRAAAAEIEPGLAGGGRKPAKKP
jgi:hypothetical protein